MDGVEAPLIIALLLLDARVHMGLVTQQAIAQLDLPAREPALPVSAVQLSARVIQTNAALLLDFAELPKVN